MQKWRTSSAIHSIWKCEDWKKGALNALHFGILILLHLIRVKKIQRTKDASDVYLDVKRVFVMFALTGLSVCAKCTTTFIKHLPGEGAVGVEYNQVIVQCF